MLTTKKLLNIALCLSILFTCSVCNYSSAEDAESYDIEESVDSLFNDLYDAWNKHDIDKVFSFYGNNFVSGDGLDKDQFKNLTENLWENYPDIKIINKKRSLRVEDQYANISVIDFFQGVTKNEHEELQIKGELNGISQGQLFLRKYGNTWKIESDRANFELVTIHYGDVKDYLDQNLIYFSTPEQVKSGEQYSGTLYFVLPDEIQATASINKELIIRPQQDVKESFQTVLNHKLERLFAANDENYNELASATIILSKGLIEPKLEGLVFIAKRINVIPDRSKLGNSKIANTSFAELADQDKENGGQKLQANGDKDQD